MNKPEFNLEHQFLLYLQRVGLSDTLMSVAQMRETKRAFMGACGQMLVVLRDDLGELDEEQGVETLQNMLEQVSNFWLVETKRAN